MTLTCATYDADEVEQFDERRVEKVVLVSVGNERVDHRTEQIKSRDVSVIELILQTNALPQQPQRSWTSSSSIKHLFNSACLHTGWLIFYDAQHGSGPGRDGSVI